jgi:hypothetical protein
MAKPHVFEMPLSRKAVAKIRQKRYKKIQKMTLEERGRELRRIVNLVLAYSRKEDNARCWHEEQKLAARILRQPHLPMGEMRLPENVLFTMCRGYIHRQQCTLHGCTKKCH